MNLLNGAGVLLIAAALIFSFVAGAANTDISDELPDKTQIGCHCGAPEKNPNVLGDVLWDNGGWQCWGGGNTRGDNTTFGKAWLEMADDFVVDDNWVVEDGHFEGLCIYDNLQVDEVLVRFFEDNGDLPAEDPFFEEYSTDFDVSQEWDACGWYHTYIDVNFGPVALTPGDYWVQMTPVGCPGDWHYSAYSLAQQGDWCAHRDGDPTGGYQGGYGSYDWIHYNPGYDMHFVLTGYIGGLPEFEVTISKGLGITATIENIGTDDATNVEATITTTGGFILFGGTKTVSVGDLAVGDTGKARSFLIGIGNIAIEVEVTCDEGATGYANTTGFLLLFFVL